jgi:membrane protein DedA with SNARE-associated domain
MTAALASLLHPLGPLGLLFVLAAVFAESGMLVGFFLPGDSLLFLTGALVASHVLALPIWSVTLGVVAAAAIGDQLGFAIGRRFGPRLFHRPESRLFKPAHAEGATAFFHRHGPLAVVLARFLPVIRTFVPAVAGMSMMPRGRFTLFNLGGAAFWGGSWVTIGYLFGGVPFIAAHIDVLTLALAGTSVLPPALGLWRKRRDRRHPRDDEPAQMPRVASRV